MSDYCEIKKYFKYEKKTGKIFWLVNRYRNKKGDEVGTLTNHGYLTVTLFKKRYYVHRLVWFFENNEFPKCEIDHINGIKSDNRIENLRKVSVRKNHHNLKIHRDGRLPNAIFDKKSNKWICRFRYKGEKIYLGRFVENKQAYQAMLNFFKNKGEEI